MYKLIYRLLKLNVCKTELLICPQTNMIQTLQYFSSCTPTPLYLSDLISPHSLITSLTHFHGVLLTHQVLLRAFRGSLLHWECPSTRHTHGLLSQFFQGIDKSILWLIFKCHLHSEASPENNLKFNLLPTSAPSTVFYCLLMSLYCFI